MYMSLPAVNSVLTQSNQSVPSRLQHDIGTDGVYMALPAVTSMFTLSNQSVQSRLWHEIEMKGHVHATRSSKQHVYIVKSVSTQKAFSIKHEWMVTYMCTQIKDPHIQTHTHTYTHTHNPYAPMHVLARFLQKSSNLSQLKYL